MERDRLELVNTFGSSSSASHLALPSLGGCHSTRHPLKSKSLNEKALAVAWARYNGFFCLAARTGGGQAITTTTTWFPLWRSELLFCIVKPGDCIELKNTREPWKASEYFVVYAVVNMETELKLLSPVGKEQYHKGVIRGLPYPLNNQDMIADGLWHSTSQVARVNNFGDEHSKPLPFHSIMVKAFRCQHTVWMNRLLRRHYDSDEVLGMNADKHFAYILRHSIWAPVWNEPQY